MNIVQGRNTLEGYLRNRTFYIPERKYAYKYAPILILFNVVVFYYYLFVGTFAIIEVNLIWESTLSKSDYLIGRERGYLKIFLKQIVIKNNNIK
jgi:dolichyl-phosphate-mannose--protein O-mannosyl transferase